MASKDVLVRKMVEMSVRQDGMKVQIDEMTTFVRQVKTDLTKKIEQLTAQNLQIIGLQQALAQKENEIARLTKELTAAQQTTADDIEVTEEEWEKLEAKIREEIKQKEVK